MQAVELTLLSYEYSTDDIGQEEVETIETVVPIIKQKSIMFEEFYEANQQGLHPEVNFIISALNYNGEKDLIYMGTKYSIIKVKSSYIDEVTLTCERKVGDVNDTTE